MSTSLRAQISALLFATLKPLTTEKIAEICRAEFSPGEDNASGDDVSSNNAASNVVASDNVPGNNVAGNNVAAKFEVIENELLALQQQLRQADLGFELLAVGNTWQFRTKPELARCVAALIPPQAKRLSKAAAETLALIAYKQPISKADIESVRGVDATPTLKTLLEARLVRIVSRAETIGQPALYGTTEAFLDKFGLKDLSELPSVHEVVELDSDPGEGDPGEGDPDQRDSGVEPTITSANIRTSAEINFPDSAAPICASAAPAFAATTE